MKSIFYNYRLVKFPLILNVSLICLFFISCPVIAQSNNICFANGGGIEIPEPVDTTTNCKGNSTVFQNYFTKVNNYIPYTNQNPITTTPKKIKVKVIVVTNTLYDSTGAYPEHFTPNDTSTITHYVQNLCYRKPNTIF